MLIGYMRVSSDSDRQNTNLQRDALVGVASENGI
jgi:DNA invertase Pin-like site-specific DNA recombinase